MSVPHSSRQITTSLGKFWTVANILSLSRLVLAFPAAYLVFQDGPLFWILAVVVVGIVSDWFDGQVARWSNTVSDWGKVLDPLADKVCAVMVVSALTLRGSLPPWFFALLVLRETLIVSFAVILTRRIGEVVMSIWWGKVAVTAVAITIFAALLHASPDLLRWCVWVTAVLLVYSAYLYLRRFQALMQEAHAAAAAPRERWDAHPAPADGGAPQSGAELARSR